jgi:hypothetical protein
MTVTIETMVVGAVVGANDGTGVGNEEGVEVDTLTSVSSIFP